MRSIFTARPDAAPMILGLEKPKSRLLAVMHGPLRPGDTMTAISGVADGRNGRGGVLTQSPRG